MLTTMLVEDQVSFRKAVHNELLAQFPSMKVIEASNGEEALKALASNPTDLIFMDISLPGENGISLTQKIRALDQAPGVVMLSGYDFEGYRTPSFQAGANGFIGKDSAGLAEKINNIVRCFHVAKEAGRSKPGCLLM